MMTLSTTSRLISKIYKVGCKHAGIKPQNLNDPKVQEQFKKRREEMELESEFYATKQYFTQQVAYPFMHYSIYEDDSLKSASFDNFDKSFSKESEQNFYKAGKITKEYLDGKKFNTLITGPCGRGKSHLALSILKSVLKTRKPNNSGIFVDVNAMMQKIKNGFDSHQPVKDVIEKRLSNVYLVVLDDLGAEHVSDFDREVLLNIINSQHRIIITTNLMANEIKDKYGDRICSRLCRGLDGHVIQFTDKTSDHRRS